MQKLPDHVSSPSDQESSQEEIIEKVNEYIEKIQNAKTKQEKEQFLTELRVYLEKSSEELAHNGDFYEAGGRLFSAGYYLEELYPKDAQIIYKKALAYYEKDLLQKITEGAFSEASNIALKIATIYHEKLADKENEFKYIHKAIDLVKNQIAIIEGIGTQRELSTKYQMMAMLYVKVEEWALVIEFAKKALELAKNIKEFSIIANAYNDLALATEHLEDPHKAQNIIFEAMDYFAKEATQFEQNQDLFPLAQIYQIMKNFYTDLRDPHRFQIFSRKEAAVYIALAKATLLNENSNAQVASYYRGAALCYRETKLNDLDCATCFFLAGNYYNEAKRYVEASINYQDAAIVFEKLQKFKKASELFVKAGENAVKANNLEIAIENFIHAYDTLIHESTETRKIINLLVKYLIQLARIQETADNSFVAGTLYLEAAFYIEKLLDHDPAEFQQYFENMQKNYVFAVKIATEMTKKSSLAYVYALASITSKILDNNLTAKNLLEELAQLKSKTAFQYTELTQRIEEFIDKKEFIDLSRDNKFEKLLNTSDELQKIIILYNNKFVKKNSLRSFLK